MRILEFGDEPADSMAPYLAVDRTEPRHECWVTGHIVAGLDGTAAIGGKVDALFTDVDEKLFRQMRQIADVVLAGAETAPREGYGLVRLSDYATPQRQPLGKPPPPPIPVVTGSLQPHSSKTLFSHAPEY